MVVKDGEHEFEEWLELNNGCLCCTVKDNGVQAIENLMKRKGKFDYILLETSGVADPGPIANIFWLDDGLASELYLDGIVTVLDAENILKSLDDVNENDGISTAHVQIALADVIVLNKIDRIKSNEKLDNIHKRVEGINSVAKIYDTKFSNVPLDVIFDIRSYDSNNTYIEKSFHSHGWHDKVCFQTF